MKKSSSSKVDRRKFLTGVAVAGAAAATGAAKAAPAQTPPPAAQRPSTAAAQREVSTVSVASPADGNPNLTKGKPGSDFMLDVIKSLDIDYVFTNPASSCRGLHARHHLGRLLVAIADDVHARGIRDRDGPWLFQGRGKTRDRDVPRHGRPPARDHGHLQRLVRPRARHPDDRQQRQLGHAQARRADDALGAGPRRDGARYLEMGRPAGLAPALRGIAR